MVSREQLEKATTIDTVQTLLKEAPNPRMALQHLIEIVSAADEGLLDNLREVVKQKKQEVKAKRER